jgi:RHS repeat-associated protein
VYGHGLIGREDAAGRYRTYHYDARGSTTLLTDEQGQVTDRYTYGVYGEDEGHEGKTRQPYRYNGRDGVQTDVDGLLYMRARYYHPRLKRFLNRDVLRGSILDGQTFNRYAYVNGDPVGYVDPLGLCKEWSDTHKYTPAVAGTGTYRFGGPGYLQMFGATKGTGNVPRIKLELAKPGEDLFVGTYNQSRYGNLKSGLNDTHTPHHVVQDAVSPTSHGKGITINIRKDIHEVTETFGSRRDLNNLRDHLAADVKELRNLLGQNGYDNARINVQLQELIRQNKLQGGFGK